MELNYIEAFIAIERTKSFSNAATVLFISQPAISRRVKLLEQELGTTLFERVRGGVRDGVRLTSAGRAFLPYAQRALAALGDGAAAVRALQEESSGLLTLALVGTLASTDLTDKLQAFRSMHEQVDLRLRTARSVDVSTLVRNGDVQLGLRYFFDGSSDFVELPVWHEQQVVVCSGRRTFPEGETLTVEHLRGIPWSTYPLRSTGIQYGRVLQNMLVKAGLDSAESNPIETIIIDSLTAQKRMVEADFALGLLPISSVQEELRLGTLRQLDLPELDVAVPVVALYRRNGFMSHAAQTLLELLST